MGREHPIRVRIGPDGDNAYSGLSILGSKPVRVSFKDRRGKVFAMVWEKVEGHPGKRAECRRARD